MADYILVVELDIPNELEDDFNRAMTKSMCRTCSMSPVCMDATGTKWRYRRMTTSHDTPPCIT